jgi:hypothetical protein
MTYIEAHTHDKKQRINKSWNPRKLRIFIFSGQLNDCFFLKKINYKKNTSYDSFSFSMLYYS